MKQNWPIPKIKHETFRLCVQLLPLLRVKVVRLHLDVYDFFNKAEIDFSQMKNIYLKTLFALCSLSILSFQLLLGATYYSAAETDISSTNNWWTNTNATGSHPSNFTSNGDIFIVQAEHSCFSSASIGFKNNTFTVNGTLTPAASAVFSGTGTTLNGSGTLFVTRIISETDNFTAQYNLASRTLSSLTLDFIGSAQQYFTSSFVELIYKLRISNNVQYTVGNFTRLRYLEVFSGDTFALQSFNIEVNAGMINNGTITGSANDAIYTDNANAAYSIDGDGTYPYVKLGNGTGPYTITGNNTFSTLLVSGGNLILNCGTTTTLTDLIVSSARVVIGDTGLGKWARTVNTNTVSNSGTVGSASTYLAFSGTITGGTVVNDGTNVLQSSSQAATCVPLPIELLSFTARKSGGSVLLEWTTATEINNVYFTIERSLDAIHFEDVANVKGAGNSANEIKYSYSDASAPIGTLFYRLKSTDIEEKFSYSNLIWVNFENLFEPIIYPNPFNYILNFTLDKEVLRWNTELKIYNSFGIEVCNKILTGSSTTLETSHFAPGVYFYSILSNNRELASGKLICEK